jgi:hypothetical protein
MLIDDVAPADIGGEIAVVAVEGHLRRANKRRDEKNCPEDCLFRGPELAFQASDLGP